MFVRWQLYRSQATYPVLRTRRESHARRKAVLVESVRVDGKPRQRHVAFLGSVCIDGSDRHRFWYRATRCLDQLGISREDRDRIGAALSGKGEGRLLTAEEIEAYERKSAELRAELGL